MRGVLRAHKAHSRDTVRTPMGWVTKGCVIGKQYSTGWRKFAWNPATWYIRLTIIPLAKKITNKIEETEN